MPGDAFEHLARRDDEQREIAYAMAASGRRRALAGKKTNA